MDEPLSLNGGQSNSSTTSLTSNEIIRDDYINVQEAMNSDTDSCFSEDHEAIEMKTENTTASATSLKDPYFLPEKSVEVLKKWFYDHATNPYPSKEEKRVLAKKSKLALARVIIKVYLECVLLFFTLNFFYLQVDNWFSNKRQHSRKRDEAMRISNEGKQEKKTMTRRCKRFHTNSIEVLKHWFDNHLNNPYPDNIEKETLAKKSGLTVLQVSLRFILAMIYLCLKNTIYFIDHKLV
jgi:hypothetical protein